MLSDEEIAAIKARVNTFHRSHDEACFHMKMDARMLLAEVERLRALAVSLAYEGDFDQADDATRKAVNAVILSLGTVI